MKSKKPAKIDLGLSFYDTYSDELLTYNARDCNYTARIYQELLKEPEWKEERVQKLYRVHSELSVLCAQMHTTGLHVNERGRQFMIQCLTQEYNEKRRKFLKLVNLPAMRCNDNDMRALIYSRHETRDIRRFSLRDPFDPRMFTDETMEKISVDEESLLLLIVGGGCPKELVPIIDAFWDAKQAYKRRSFLVSEKTLHAVGPDGCLRPSWNSCGTDTMRFSARDPNVMQWEKQLRFMVGTKDGDTLVGLDKSQLEVRVIEHISQDDFLYELMCTGDVYSADAKDAFSIPDGINVKKDRPAQRQACKITRLASNYMASLPTVFAQYLKQDRTVTFDKVRLLYNRFHRVHEKGIVAYAKAEQRFTNQHGYSEGRVLFGRRYYPRPPTLQEACNWPIQRTASEMMNKETLRYRRVLQKEIPNAYIVFQNHDAIVTKCREKDAERVKKLAAKMFTTEYTIAGRTRPYPVEIKIGRTLDEV